MRRHFPLSGQNRDAGPNEFVAGACLSEASVMLADVTGDSRAGAPGTLIKVLVVELDGGAARTTLRTSPDMDVLAAESFEKATALLPTTKVQAVLVALGPLRPS